MNDEERKKLIEELLEASKLVVNPTTLSSTSFSWDMARKPEPIETDENGNIVGYKVLVFDLERLRFFSPLYQAYWKDDGWLESDEAPREGNKNGIYTLKSLDSHELDSYYHQEEYKNRTYGYSSGYNHRDQIKLPFKVRCIISGVIVEGEYGFRSQFAQVEGVYNGYWKTYQDFYNEARYESRRRTEHLPYQDFTRYSDSYRTYVAGAWDTRPKLADEDPEESGS